MSDKHEVLKTNTSRVQRDFKIARRGNAIPCEQSGVMNKLQKQFRNVAKDCEQPIIQEADFGKADRRERRPCEQSGEMDKLRKQFRNVAKDCEQPIIQEMVPKALSY